MIVTIRGTHGSGKSTLVRAFLDLNNHATISIDGRKRPFGYYLLKSELVTKSVFIAGHYETPCGGCDSIPKVEDVYNAVREQHDKGFDVLFEGILAQHSNPNLLKLHHSGYPLVVIGLTTTADVASSRVSARRVARGDLRVFDPKNVIKEHRSVESGLKRLKEAGVNVMRLSDKETLTAIPQLFGWSCQ